MSSEKNAIGSIERSAHVLGLLVLMVWAMVFTALLVSDRFRMYLVPAFKPLLILALVILSACFVAKFALGYSHGHDPARGAVWVRVALLVLPLLYLACGYGDSLGSYAFSQRQTMGTLGMTYTRNGEPDPAESPLPPSGEIAQKNLLEIAWNNRQLMDRKILTLGQVTWDPQAPENHFVLFQFVINCCVADAQPVAFLVQFENRESLVEDAWVEVIGTLKTSEIAGRSTIVIQGESVRVIDEPYDMYIYNF
jgi:putative membrane protein